MNPNYVTMPTVSGNIDGAAAGTTTGGTALHTKHVERGSLSCLFAVTAATSSITMTGKWQVSNDNSTWYDISAPNNPANVALATGTVAEVTEVLAAPDAAWGWKYVRPAIINGAVEGNATDLYEMTAQYRRATGF